MGITNLFSMCQQAAPDAVVRMTAGKPEPGGSSPTWSMSSYDHVYYDVNNVIYSLLSKHTTHEELFYVRLYKDIDAMLKSSRPRHSLFLAVDGPGPRAKVSTQLARRRRYPYTPNKELQRVGFTPGTGLMHRLQQALLVYAATRSALARNKNLAVWVSGSDCAGEGENKCFHHMRRVPVNHRCLVVGNDSDLIAYGLRAHCEVHIMRVGSATSQSALLNTKLLRERLAAAAGASPAEEGRVADDFLFLSLMSGNDYVPSLIFYDFKTMWQAYKRVKKSDPEYRGKFVFDAQTRVVDWKLLQTVLEMTGTWEVDVADEGPGGGRLHVRQVINEMLAQGGDEVVFEADPLTTQNGLVVLKLTSARCRKPWSVTGQGRSQRLAMVDASFKALAEGSPFFEHFVENEDYAPDSLKKIAKLLGLLRAKTDEVVQWFRRRELVERDFSFVSGHVPGYPPEMPLDLAKPPVPSHDLYMRYLEGLVWSFEMYGGSVKNFGYHYPFQDRFSLIRLCRAAPQVSETWDTLSRATPPLSPIALGLCLLGGQARKLLPAPFCDLEPEKDPQLGPIFRDDSEALLRDRERLTENLNKVEEYAKRVAEEHKDTLSPEAKHLLSLHNPTCFMDRSNPLLRTFARSELDAFLYMPPKLPKLKHAYTGLKDAPPSSRIVAAVNVPKTAQGHWFRLSHPYMQTRKFAVMRLFCRK